MKKIAILVASVIVLGGFGTRAYADGTDTQTTQTTEAVVSYKEKAGITPDSLLYTIDKAVDQLRLVLANSEEKKAEVNADIAQERLGESEVMTEKGKVELALKALEEYNQKITEAANKLQEVVANLQATTLETGDEAIENEKEDKLEQSIVDLEKAIQGIQEKSLVVLDSLKGVVSEESTEAVKEIIEEQTTHKEAVANFVKERHEFNAAKKSLNMAKVALKKVEKSGNEEAVKAAQEKLAEAQKEYMAAQTELHASFQAKKAADSGIEENKEETKSEDAVQTPAEGATNTAENNQTVDETVTKDESVTAEKEATTDKSDAAKAPAKEAEYTKTNNGNGNGNGSKQEKVEKEKKDKEQSAPGKSGEANGKAGQANNGKKK